MPDFILHYSYIFVSVISFVTNIPLGYYRKNTRKFSFMWFFLIHASIPLIIYLRIALDAENWIIPVNIFLAVVAQLWGQSLNKKPKTEEKKDKT